MFTQAVSKHWKYNYLNLTPPAQQIKWRKEVIHCPLNQVRYLPSNTLKSSKKTFSRLWKTVTALKNLQMLYFQIWSLTNMFHPKFLLPLTAKTNIRPLSLSKKCFVSLWTKTTKTNLIWSSTIRPLIRSGISAKV